jgi:ribonuclease VapC
VILDTSAILSVILAEPDARAFESRIDDADLVGVGSPTLVEAGIVLGSRLPTSAPVVLERYLSHIGAEIIPFGEEHWKVAVVAAARFGKGRHPAALNLGDCLSYATARVAARPLLCKVDDFARTDIELA